MAVALRSNDTESITVLRLAGDISLTEMDAVLRTMTDMVLENRTKVVLNFRQVNHVSLNAISKLAEKNQRLRALGGDIKLVGLIPYVANLFKLVGAFSYFDLASSEEEAVARFEC